MSNSSVIGNKPTNCVEVIEDHKAYVTVTCGIRGWFAVMMWWNQELGGFWEPWNTGDGSYATAREAEVDAKCWAEAEGIEFCSYPKAIE